MTDKVPAFTDAWRVFYYGLKKFSRALSAAEVAADAVCRDEPTVDDYTFTDTIGNGCAFYAQLREARGGSQCSAEVAARCPIACGLTRECPKRATTDRFFGRTLKFSPPVLCTTPAAARAVVASATSPSSPRATPPRTTPLATAPATS